MLSPCLAAITVAKDLWPHGNCSQGLQRTPVRVGDAERTLFGTCRCFGIRSWPAASAAGHTAGAFGNTARPPSPSDEPFSWLPVQVST